jgi:hypothetical protein
MKQKKKESPEEFAARLDELEFKLNPMAADPKRLMEIKKEIAEQKKDDRNDV